VFASRAATKRTTTEDELLDAVTACAACAHVALCISKLCRVWLKFVLQCIERELGTSNWRRTFYAKLWSYDTYTTSLA